MNLSNFYVMPRDLHSELMEESPLCFLVFCEFLARVRYNGNRLDLELGQFKFSTRKLADQLDISHQQARTAVQKLIKKGVISVTQLPHTSHTADNTHCSIGSIVDQRLFRIVKSEPTQLVTQQPHKSGTELTSIPDQRAKIRAVDAPRSESEGAAGIDAIYSRYPKRDGSQGKAIGLTRIKRQVAEDPLKLALFSKAVDRYADWCRGKAIVGTSYVKQFSSFATAGVWDEWADGPEAKPKSEIEQRMNIRWKS